LALERLRKYDEALGAIRRALAIEPGDVSLQKLEFRVRLLKLRSQALQALRSLWPFGRGGKGDDRGGPGTLPGNLA
jgi:hypothetical protein